MAKRKNPGQDFQDEIRRSIPKPIQGKGAPQREAWVHKPPDVPMFGIKCRAPACNGWINRYCLACLIKTAVRLRREAPGSSWASAIWEAAKKVKQFSFAPKNPLDLLVSIPYQGTSGQRTSFVPQAVFGFELKESKGRYLKKAPDVLHENLNFSRVADHQERGMRAVAAAGGVAGILWLVESDREAECRFIRIQDWDAYRAGAKGASMSLAAARLHGIEVEIDAGRGTRRRYWKLAELFRHFGADVAATPERKKKAGKARTPAVRLFEDLPAKPEELPFAPQTEPKKENRADRIKIGRPPEEFTVTPRDTKTVNLSTAEYSVVDVAGDHGRPCPQSSDGTISKHAGSETCCDCAENYDPRPDGKCPHCGSADPERSYKFDELPKRRCDACRMVYHPDKDDQRSCKTCSKKAALEPASGHPFATLGAGADDWPDDSGFETRKPQLAKKLRQHAAAPAGLRERLEARRKKP